MKNILFIIALALFSTNAISLGGTNKDNGQRGGLSQTSKPVSTLGGTKQGRPTNIKAPKLKTNSNKPKNLRGR